MSLEQTLEQMEQAIQEARDLEAEVKRLWGFIIELRLTGCTGSGFCAACSAAVYANLHGKIDVPFPGQCDSYSPQLRNELEQSPNHDSRSRSPRSPNLKD